MPSLNILIIIKSLNILIYNKIIGLEYLRRTGDFRGDNFISKMR